MIQIAALLALAAAQPTDRRLSTYGDVIDELPTVIVNHDDFKITKSCIISIPPGTIIEDDEGDGVIQLNGDYLYIEFAEGSQLLGRAGIDDWLAKGTQQGEGWDTLTGTGIAINGHEGVEIVGANIRGYRNGIVASDAPGLVVKDAEFVDMFRQRLTSTATREGSSDWLYPHNNDNNEWLNNYGAAIWAERCHGAHIEGVRVRRAQNGIILDNTNGAIVAKNDCSFLSGWGLGMWRASQNSISENRFDFCVRGHVEGVYNRGQDSAGILMFEACSENSIFKNSCTHGGDGIFGFGGNDAVKAVTEGAWGNANNIISGNDLSFAPAHGLEMTFSEGNRIAGNLMESNAICGYWGGYSQRGTIMWNRFIENGGMAYGRERGAINIEHGSGNQIAFNEFINNKVGVRLWWDHDQSLLAQPGVANTYKGVVGNSIQGNTFVMNLDHPFGETRGDEPIMFGIKLQNIGDAPDYEGPRFGMNATSKETNTWDVAAAVAQSMNIDDGIELTRGGGGSGFGPWTNEIPERRSPPGREWIICDQWGPWDFESTLMREHSRSGGQHLFEIYPPLGTEPEISFDIDGVNATITPPESDQGWRPWHLTITPRGDEPISSYAGKINIGDHWSRDISGRFISTTWNAKCWSWQNDPFVDLDAWRAEADDVEVTAIDQLDLPFGYNGPSRVNHALTVSERDRFAIIAETEIALPVGRWKLTTLSDDGIRVYVNGEMRFERWDIHGPTPDETVIEVTDDTPTQIRFEYFENTGYAMLKLDLEPVD